MHWEFETAAEVEAGPRGLTWWLGQPFFRALGTPRVFCCLSCVPMPWECKKQATLHLTRLPLTVDVFFFLHLLHIYS